MKRAAALLNQRLYTVFVVVCLSLSSCAVLHPFQLYPDVTVIQATKDSGGTRHGSSIQCFDQPDALLACDDCQETLDDIVNGTAVANKCDLPSALGCTDKTRQVDTDFLLCREERQLGFGVGLAALAAASGGMAVAGSTVAALALGTAAGTGLGLDFITFNSAKSPGFANAATQLECVYRTTMPVSSALLQLRGTYSQFAQATSACLDTDPVRRLYKAESKIAARQLLYAQTQADNFGLNVYMAVRGSQLGAFAAAQSGIPTPAQIQQGLQAMNFSIPSVSGLPPAAAAAGSCLDSSLPDIEDKGRQFRSTLSAFQLPDPLFQQCLSMSVSSGASPAGTAQSKGGGGGTGGGGTGGGTGGGGTGGNNSNNSGTSSAPGPLSAQVATTNLASIDNTGVEGGGAMIQVTGGVPPYYWLAIDQTAPIVVEAASPEVRLPNGSKGGRVLIADQAGSQQIIYLKPGTAAPQAPAACCCTAGPCPPAPVAH